MVPADIVGAPPWLCDQELVADQRHPGGTTALTLGCHSAEDSIAQRASTAAQPASPRAG